jgi:hypothetical protein
LFRIPAKAFWFTALALRARGEPPSVTKTPALQEVQAKANFPLFVVASLSKPSGKFA